MPARPEKVCCSPPMAHPSRVSSARPRVITAARVLSPVPRPSAMPEAMAITFFERAGDLAPDHVVVRVHAEEVGREHLLQRVGDAVVLHGDHAGRRVPGQDLLGQVGAGEQAVRATRELLGQHLGHAQPRALLEALREADHRHPRPQEAGQLLRGLAHPVRGHAHHEQVRRAHRLLERGRGVQARREVEALEVGAVAVVVADLRRHVVTPGPQRGGDVLGTEVSHRGAPRTSPDDGHLHRHGREDTTPPPPP